MEVVYSRQNNEPLTLGFSPSGCHPIKLHLHAAPEKAERPCGEHSTFYATACDDEMRSSPGRENKN